MEVSEGVLIDTKMATGGNVFKKVFVMVEQIRIELQNNITQNRVVFPEIERCKVRV